MTGERPTTVLILGASGDLTRRKLLPALFNLALKGRLPEGLRIVGFSRSLYSAVTAAFRRGCSSPDSPVA